jgi:tetratricopeptide (TPR) repeat protein
MLLAGLRTFACINEYIVDGKPVGFWERVAGIPANLDLDVLLAKAENLNPYLVTGFDKPLLELRKQYLEQKIKTDSNFRLLSNLAVIELKLGDLKEGLFKLEQLYKQHPEEYNIVGNLGTAYELTGNIPLAIEFLEKAIALNPNSHYGSEWIHLKILQEKAKAVPQFQNVIQLNNENNFARWLYSNSPTADKLKELKKQLFYQLKERISFVPAQDAAVGQLLKDLGDIEQKSGDKNIAKQYYDKAIEYAPSLAPAINERQNISQAKLFYYHHREILITGLIIVLLVIAYFVFRRKKNNK